MSVDQVKLRDTAFELAREQRRRTTGPAAVRRRLAELFPSAGGEDSPLLWGVYDQAVALIRRAEELAELHRQGLLKRNVAVERLAVQFPGFSDETYDAAFGEGLFATR